MSSKLKPANILDQSFYQEDVVQLSQNLLGKKLCTNINGVYTSGTIVETEAYRGSDDKACHAYGNRRTARSETMFAQGGLAYVYICYGIHHLMNIVSGDEDDPQVVLIRAIEPLDGINAMQVRRKMTDVKQLTNGPGKLSAALGITKQMDRSELFTAKEDIWIEDGMELSETQIIHSPRVGLTTAEECMNWPWRFRIIDNVYTSKPNNVFYEGYPI